MYCYLLIFRGQFRLPNPPPPPKKKKLMFKLWLLPEKIAKVRGKKLPKKVEIAYKVDHSAQIFPLKRMKFLHLLCESLTGKIIDYSKFSNIIPCPDHKN